MNNIINLFNKLRIIKSFNNFLKKIGIKMKRYQDSSIYITY